MTSQEQLDAKRAERVDAEKALVTARAALDVTATVQAQQRIAVLDEFIATLEVKVVAEREAEAKQQARQRLIGIRRAHGSVSSQMDQDEERVRSLHDELTAAIARLNDRYQQAVALGNEAAALVDRFDLDAELPPAPPAPAARNIPEPLPALLDVAPFVASPATEAHPEFDSMRRRTYREIESTQGYAIIQRAGLKAWRPLSEQEERIVGIRRERMKRDAEAGERLTPLALPSNTAIGTI